MVYKNNNVNTSNTKTMKNIQIKLTMKIQKIDKQAKYTKIKKYTCKYSKITKTHEMKYIK